MSMKHTLRIAISALLALLLLTGCALAQTIADIRAELGSCSIADYEGKTHHSFIFDGGAPYEVAEHTRDGMRVWDIGWAHPDGSVLGKYAEFWFPSRGIVADLAFDFDRDGSDEWIVLATRDATNEYYPDTAELWLNVYELDGPNATLADSTCLLDSWDCHSEFTKIFFMERSDGTPVLTVQDSHGVDGYDMTVWQLAYSDETLSIHGGVAYYPWEAGNGEVALFGSDTSMDALLECAWCFYSDDIDNGYLVTDSGKRVKIDLQGWHYGDSREDDCHEKMLSALHEYAYELDLWLEMDEDWNQRSYYMQACAASVEEILLLRADSFAVDDSDQRVFRIERRLSANAASATTTGDVNLRSGPGLDCESVGVIPADTTVEYLGEESVDERGVAWYCVRFGALEGWASSKYTQLN